MYHVQAVILFFLLFLPHISVSQEIHTENAPNPAETARKNPVWRHLPQSPASDVSPIPPFYRFSL